MKIIPPIVQAAMAGITDKMFCQKMLEFGTGMITLGGYSIDYKTKKATEEIVNRGRKETIIPIKDEKFQNWCKKNLNLKKKFSKQLITINLRFSTCDFKLIRKLTFLSEFVNIIEINAHCRQTEITKQKGGQFLIQDLAHLEKILTGIRDHIQTVNLGIKIRGHVLEDYDKFIEIAEKNHLKYIHIDCMKPGYPEADIRYLSKLVDRTKIPLIANNSIRKIQDIRYFLQKGATAVSIARPLLNNPNFIKTLIEDFKTEG